MMIDLTCRKNFGIDAVIADIVIPAIEVNSDARFVWPQDVPSREFSIIHNLDKYPSVTFINELGEHIIGDFSYVDENTIRCSFDEEFTGKVLLN